MMHQQAFGREGWEAESGGKIRICHVSIVRLSAVAKNATAAGVFISLIYSKVLP